MFGNKEKQEPTSTPRSGGDRRVNTVLGERSTFTGTLRVEGSLVINGTFEGTLTCTENLVVGKTGKVKADIDVQAVTVAGRVEGRIFAKERVDLQTGSHLLGDVHAQSFMIQDGVFFQGNCSMGDSKKGGAATPATADKPDLGILKQS